MTQCSEICVRPATTADMAGIFSVRTSVINNPLDEAGLAAIGITPATVAASLEAGESGAWCVDENETVVGFSVALLQEREVSALFVHPAHEGRGIGAALLDVAVAWLRQENDAPILLRTSPEKPAYAFYLKRGWRDLGYGPANGDGEDTYLSLE